MAAARSATEAETLRIAIDVDLAAIETRALVLVGQQVIGARNLAEPLGGLWIVRVAVRVQFLGELAIGGLDVLLAGAARYAQSRIGVGCHVAKLGWQVWHGKAALFLKPIKDYAGKRAEVRRRDANAS